MEIKNVLSANSGGLPKNGVSRLRADVAPSEGKNLDVKDPEFVDSSKSAVPQSTDKLTKASLAQREPSSDVRVLTEKADQTRQAKEEKNTRVEQENQAKQAERKAEQEQDKKEALEKAKEHLAGISGKQLALKFESSKEFDASVVNVIDVESHEVIRQIPSEEVLRVSEAINNYVERVAHEDMMTDPKLKAQGADVKSRENLRGAVFDDMV